MPTAVDIMAADERYLHEHHYAVTVKNVSGQVTVTAKNQRGDSFSVNGGKGETAYRSGLHLLRQRVQQHEDRHNG